MNFFKKLKNIFIENKEYFISIMTIFSVFFIWILSKLYLFNKDYFFALLIVGLILFISFILYLRSDKEFQEFLEEAIEENNILVEEIKKNKTDKYKIDLIIKIASILIIGVSLFYFMYADVLKIFNI